MFRNFKLTFMPGFILVDIIAGIHDICHFLMNFCYFMYLSTKLCQTTPFILVYAITAADYCIFVLLVV